MTDASSFPILHRCFAATAPGLETTLAGELAALGFDDVEALAGGARFTSDANGVMRAHLWLRCASRILIRLGEARATHFAQLDKWARKLPWTALVPPGAPISVEASAKRSKLYHTGAIAERIEAAARAALGAVSEDAAQTRVFVRIEKDLCVVSIDASGEPLHKRGHKLEIGKAPLRETLAAAYLYECGFTGDEPVVDPMCGSGTFVLEAADIAAGLAPGRDRRFAFESLSCFDVETWRTLKSSLKSRSRDPSVVFRGFDRDPGAVAAATANAARAAIGGFCSFAQQPMTALERPEGPPGLVMVNPPYGDRIGDKKRLSALYRSLGDVLRERFAGWRIGLVTNEPGLAKAAGLPFERPGPPVPHGALKIRLYRAGPLA